MAAATIKADKDIGFRPDIGDSHLREAFSCPQEEPAMQPPEPVRTEPIPVLPLPSVVVGQLFSDQHEEE
eukprot:4980235-Lingulodinium_polyedra.AAC.1